MGSMWLNSEEAHAEPAQRDSYMAATSEDTVRSRSFTGKTARMLKNEWTLSRTPPAVTPPGRAGRCRRWSRGRG